MPERNTEDARVWRVPMCGVEGARVWLRQRWGRDYDTGLAAGQWHAMRLDGTGELISAATPDELDVMIEDAETGG